MPETFPTLTSIKNCSALMDSWSESKAVDPTLRNDSEGGYTVSRAKFTRQRKKWKINDYPYLTNEDKIILEAFETTVSIGADYFTWTNWLDLTAYSVRFVKPCEFKPNKGTSYWYITMEFEQI